MEADDRRRILEAVLLASPEPLSAQRLAGALPEGRVAEVRERLAELNDAYETGGRAFRIEEVAGGYQLRTLPELAPYLQKLRPQPPLKLSRAALETLAIVAYKQPLTRAELEHVRGVDVGAVLASLIERRLVRIAGHREVPGRPMLYATTKRFLEVFGLASLSDLPTLREIEELLRDRVAETEGGEAAEDGGATEATGGEPAGPLEAVSEEAGDEPAEAALDDELDGDEDDDDEPEADDVPTTH